MALLIILIVPFVAFHTMPQTLRTEWEAFIQIQRQQFRAPDYIHAFHNYKTSVELGYLTSICLKSRCEPLSSPKLILK